MSFVLRILLVCFFIGQPLCDGNRSKKTRGQKGDKKNVTQSSMQILDPLALTSLEPLEQIYRSRVAEQEPLRRPRLQSLQGPLAGLEKKLVHVRKELGTSGHVLDDEDMTA